METIAVAKYIRVSPQKMRLVANLIRGKDVETALNILAFTPKSSAPLITKVLKSAIANVKNNITTEPNNILIIFVRLKVAINNPVEKIPQIVRNQPIA